MGRKSLANERREQILDAFEVCIRQCGLEGSSLEKVAQEAGVKRSIIRHYIGNRSDLIAAAVDRIINTYQQDLAAAVQNLPQNQLMPELLDYLFCYEEGGERSHYDILTTALWAAHERDPNTHQLLLNLYQEFETLIFQALTHAYPHSPQSQRQGIAFSIMCLAN
ncbi:MAG: TetR/AcrR family transcriptional regulator, partial [Chloroflexi bacterium]|nr:TetR/AcrR family transcriptional regulator [Chloroflexota bacterium]